jgi:hypothetical protein
MAAAFAAAFPNSAARLLYDRLAAAPCAVHFLTLPDPVLFPDYYYFIRHPVALSDMARAMTLGRYTLADMQRDVRRMIANAKKYNKPEAVVYQDSLELEVSRGWLQWFLLAFHCTACLRALFTLVCSLTHCFCSLPHIPPITAHHEEASEGH